MNKTEISILATVMEGAEGLPPDVQDGGTVHVAAYGDSPYLADALALAISDFCIALQDAREEDVAVRAPLQCTPACSLLDFVIRASLVKFKAHVSIIDWVWLADLHIEELGIPRWLAAGVRTEASHSLPSATLFVLDVFRSEIKDGFLRVQRPEPTRVLAIALLLKARVAFELGQLRFREGASPDFDSER